MATGASAASASSACPFRSGIRCLPTGRATMHIRSRPAEDRLPIDPSTDVPDGYRADQRDQPGGFTRRSRCHGHVGDVVAEPADCRQVGGRSRTSSRASFRWTSVRRRTTSSGRGCSRPCCDRIWSSIRLPWRHAAISGWVLDPDRKKMSKSKGNVVTPMALLEEHGSDGVRYWAASGRPGSRHGVRHGADARRPTARDQAAQRVEVRARRLEPGASTPAWRRDVRSGRSRLAGDGGPARAPRPPTISRTTTTPASCERTEALFWFFCDNYLELVKSRRYGDQGPEAAASANAALTGALSVLLRLFAPFLPFVTEEVWSWWQSGSIHRAAWPTSGRTVRPRRGAHRRATSGRWSSPPPSSARFGRRSPRNSGR